MSKMYVKDSNGKYRLVEKDRDQKGTPEDFVKDVIEGPYKETLKQLDARLKRLEGLL